MLAVWRKLSVTPLGKGAGLRGACAGGKAGSHRVGGATGCLYGGVHHALTLCHRLREGGNGGAAAGAGAICGGKDGMGVSEPLKEKGGEGRQDSVRAGRYGAALPHRNKESANMPATAHAPNPAPQHRTGHRAAPAKGRVWVMGLVAVMAGMGGAMPLAYAAPATPAHGATRPAATVVLSKSAQAVRQEALQVGAARFTAPDYKPGVVEHIVLFQFKPTATPAQRQEVTKRFMALAQQARRADGTLVIKSLEAGPQKSGEGADLGLDYGYVVRFASAGDRNYYVGRPIVHEAGQYDPAHDAFKAFAAPYLANVVVFDFTPTP